MNTTLGALAAVATALVWAFSSTVFTLASLRAGAMAVNRVRLLMAVGWLVAAGAVAAGTVVVAGAAWQAARIKTNSTSAPIRITGLLKDETRNLVFMICSS